MIVYSSATCPNCRMVKMKLDKAGIPYEVCEDTAKMEELGIKSLPVIEFNGELLKFSKANLDRVLKEAAE